MEATVDARRKWQRDYNDSPKGLKRRAAYRRRHKINLRFYYRAYHRKQRRQGLEHQLDKLEAALAKTTDPRTASIIQLDIESVQAKLRLIALADRADQMKSTGN